MNVNDRVVFKGPTYSHTLIPFVGQVGTITERNGYRVTSGEGATSEELITVHFDGDEKATVLSINRVELVV